MARVFSAVDIEDEKLLRNLKDVRETLNLGFNPVKMKKMHVTLEFFKDVDEEGIEQIKEAMKRIELSCFKADIKGVGAFPSEDHIRVVWAGVGAEEFHDLYRQVSDHSVESSNNHEFKPHITLMRVKNPSKEQKKKLQRTLREFKDEEFGKIKVDRLKLFESHLNGKINYKKLHEKKL